MKQQVNENLTQNILQLNQIIDEIQKSNREYHVIRELQNQRKLLETPLLSARRTLRSIEQENESQKRSTTRQTDRMKGAYSSTFTRPY
ncbi:unnamed protein product [Paramecium sonneborni]|uniref:Uncharacterized protein n=1 Tax=Paramecium sonneborni TaxID=65129 RepID=A0A8S1R460_9CILI|nr:unnamed protein product [Paramecium sonneborni]